MIELTEGDICPLCNIEILIDNGDGFLICNECNTYYEIK